MEKIKKAFTLVELLVVVAILAVLASVSIIGYLGFVEKARISNDQQLVSQINNLIKAEDSYTFGTSNDALEIQSILRRDGIKEIKTQSKGNYIFFDNDNRKAVLAYLNDEGINIVFGDSSSNTSTINKLNTNYKVLANYQTLNTKSDSSASKGKFLDLIYAPESFINGYTFITTDSRDGLANNIVNIRNGGGNNDIRQSKISIKNSISKIKSSNLETGTLIENMTKYCCFVNSKQEQIIMNGTSKRDIVTMIFSSDITTIGKKAFENIDDMSLTMIDIPSSVTSIEEDAVSTLLATEKLSNVSITSSNDELYNDVENKLKDLSASDDDSKKVLDTFTKTENRNQELTNIKVNFRNSIDDVNEDSNYLSKSVVINKNTSSIQISPKMDVDYLKSKSLTYSNLYFDGFYVNDTKIDESTGKFEFTKTQYENGYPNEIDVIAKWKTSYDSPKFKTFAYVSYENYSKYNFVYSDSIILSLVNNEQLNELFNDVPNTSNSDNKLEYGGDLGGYVIYPIGDNYELNINLTISKEVTLWIPYSCKFDNVSELTSKFEFTHDSTGNSLSSTKQTYGCDYTRQKSQNEKLNKTFKINSVLNNYGTIRIGATIYSNAGIDSGIIGDDYAMIENHNQLNNYGDIFAIGILKNFDNENAIIKALSGSIYEEIILKDWHGGTNAAGCKYGNVAPFNSWELRNIMGEISFYDDSNYYASLFVYAAGSFNVGTLPIIGANSLFHLNDNNSYIKKRYDFNNDYKLELELYGSISDAKVSLNLGISVLVTEVDLSVIPFPLSNTNITLCSGSNLSLEYNKYKILPDSLINVNKNASLNINTDFALYEKFIRTDVDKKWNMTYDQNNNMKGAYIMNEGTINIGDEAKFSGDIKQNSKDDGTLNISSKADLTTNFKEGWGYEAYDGDCDPYKCTFETNLITGSYNHEDYKNGINYTKIIINGEEEYITN